MTSVETPKRQLSERDLAMTPVLSAKSFGRVNDSLSRGLPAAPAVPLTVLAAFGPHRLSWTQSLSLGVLASCFVDVRPRSASSFCGECSGDCSNADDDPPLIIQDMDLFSSLAFDLGHTENPTPNGFEVRRRMALPRQARPISADQAKLVIRHSVSSLIRLAFRETSGED